MSLTTTDAPSLANLWAMLLHEPLSAIASPMPAPAPVTIATFPSKRLSTFQPPENLVKNSESTSPFEF
ncbi:hypothetical protein [Scytonema sp. HK-05]|uniref:hypothetical protein n=1 Tax=Scytonema sp. HK-05 TaxID=1137095 RepID=UPI001E3862C4|nr:hypothetical protein [Scytonema sp. HK-05]